MTPTSRTSTLRRGTGSDYHKAYAAAGPAASPVSATHHLQQHQHHQQQPHQLYDAIGVITSPSAAGASERPEYLSFERHTLDYRLNGNTSNGKPSTDGGPLRNGVPLGPRADFIGSGGDYAVGRASPSTLTPTASGAAATALLLQQRINQSTATLQRLQQHAHNGANAGTTTSRQSRNHIITDTLPGPESCV